MGLKAGPAHPPGSARGTGVLGGPWRLLGRCSAPHVEVGGSRTPAGPPRTSRGLMDADDARLDGGTGVAGSIPAACACHERSGAACDFGTASVPCPPWMSITGPMRGGEPCPSPWMQPEVPKDWRAPAIAQPIPIPSHSAPSILVSPLSEPGPSRAPRPCHGPAPARTLRDSSQAAAWGGGLPVCPRHLPLALETVQPSGFKPPRQHLQQPQRRRRCSSTASPCLPARPCPLCPCPCPRHCPCAPPPTLPQLAAAVQGLRHCRQRARELPWHAVHGEHGRARQPPTCLRAAGQARKSQRFLRSPSPGAFSSGTGWPQPNRGVLPGLLLPGWRGRAGVRAQLCIPWPQPKLRGSGLGDAWRGRGASLPCRARATAVCSRGGCRATPQLPVLPAPRQAVLPPPPREFVGRVLAACSRWGGGVNRWC